jgi:hypothetical protein
MTKKSQTDALMIRYLLGSATEAEQLQIEERFFQDEDAYLELQALEDELRYEYAQGGLSSEQRKQFEARFLKTAKDRSKVELAGSVLGKLDQVRAETPAAVETRQAKPSWFASLFASPRFSFGAAAAALFVVAAGSWFALDSMRLRQEVARLEQQQKQIAAEGQQQLAQARQELDAERARGKEQVKKNPPAIFGFLLLPGLVRDANGMKRLTIPAGVAEVALQFDVKAKGDFTSYRAELQDLDGTTLWSGKTPQPSVSIPARILRPGDYVVLLKGVSALGQASDAGEFYFRVVQR